jgi:hypothetical protein
MESITLSSQAMALLVGLLALLVVAVSILLLATTAILYRQALRERDRLLDERERVIEELRARLVDLWRDLETKEDRISTLEGANERLQRLACDATDGWMQAVVAERVRLP